jgi:hypothetical protein
MSDNINSNTSKKKFSFDSATDKELISMAIAGKLSRNRHFDFFKTERGQTIFKKAKRLQGFIKDMNNGGKIVEKTVENGLVRLIIENKIEKYKRTAFMDITMFDILNDKF